MTHPLIQSGLAALNLDLEQELDRYKQQRTTNSLIQSGKSGDSLLSGDQELSTQLEYSLNQNFNEDDLFADVDLAIALEEEFPTSIPLPEPSNPDLSSNLPEEPEDKSPNLLSPLGILAMLVLLVSSAAVGYLLVDPSGLKRLIKPEDSKTPSSRTEFLFLAKDNPNNITSSQPIPFVDFTSQPPQSAIAVLDKSQLANSLVQNSPISKVLTGRSFNPSNNRNSNLPFNNSITSTSQPTAIKKPTTPNPKLVSPSISTNTPIVKSQPAKPDQTLPNTSTLPIAKDSLSEQVFDATKPPVDPTTPILDATRSTSQPKLENKIESKAIATPETD